MPSQLPSVEAAPSQVPVGPSSAYDPEIRLGIIHTEVRRPVAVLLTLVFLLAIYAVPLGQAYLEHRREEPPFVLELFKRAPTPENLRKFEEDLEQNSDAKSYVQPRVQAALTRYGRVGNKQAVIGHAGFLYYVPGVSYVSGPGFLQPGQLAGRERAVREAGKEPVHPDPRPAIYAFQAALSQRNIALVLFPAPDKAMLEPGRLHARSHGPEVPRNLDWPRFASEMRARGVMLFDPSPERLLPNEAPRYLIQDTHWTPEFMRLAAERLAVLVKDRVALPPLAAAPRYQRTSESVARVGDITDMLKLPEGQSLFAPQSVTIEVVKDADGQPWEPDEAADVLLLGDSFTNIYSLDYMGWGASAGLAAQLAFALGRPVDVIAQNDSGAFATRAALSQELAANPARLAGKRVVIWEFAARELAVGDWKPVTWPAAPAKQGAAP
jgi:alginate O-acetyltransferase complex protein AlgJ